MSRIVIIKFQLEMRTDSEETHGSFPSVADDSDSHATVTCVGVWVILIHFPAYVNGPSENT